MNDLPDQVFLRRSVVREWLGLSEEAFTKLVNAGSLKARYLVDGGRAYFLRSEVVNLRTQGNDPGPMSKDQRMTKQQ